MKKQLSPTEKTVLGRISVKKKIGIHYADPTKPHHKNGYGKRELNAAERLVKRGFIKHVYDESYYSNGIGYSVYTLIR